MNKISIQIKIAIILLLFSIGRAGYVTGQKAPDLKTDSIQNSLQTIPLGQIAIRSAETMITTKQDVVDLIPTGTIMKLRTANEIVLASIDRKLFEKISPEDVHKNIRFLEKRRVALLIEKQKIIDQKAELAAVFDYINNLNTEVNQETVLWENTRKQVLADSLNQGVLDKINETLSFLDSTHVLISGKSNALMEIYDKTIATEIEIDTHIEKIRGLIITKRAGAFVKDHSPFFELDFRTNYLNEITDSIKLKTTIELAELKSYLEAQSGYLILTILIFIALYFYFRKLQNRLEIKQSGFGFEYKEKVMKMLANPGSAAILLSLFAAAFLFPERPLIFKEVTIYIIAFPMIQLLSKLLDGKFRSYLFAYGGLIVFYLVLLLVSNESVLYRFLLLFIAFAEIALLIYFLLRYDKNNMANDKLKYYIAGFVWLHTGLVLVGLISNLTGRVTLTEIMIGSVFLNIFNLLVIRNASLILNGLIAIGVDSERGHKLNFVVLHGEIIKEKTIKLVNTLAVILWIVITLYNFNIFDVIYGKLGSMLSYKVTVFSTSFSLDTVLIFLLVIYISVVISNIIRTILEQDILSRLSLSKGLPHSIATAIKYTLVTGGFFLAVGAAGIPVDKITIILGAMSVGIGFGLQNIFNNIVSGLILLFERPIQLGDTVQVGQLTGHVKTIGLRASNIRTFEGAEVIVPNGQLISTEVINWTLSDQNRRVEIMISVSYNSDPKQVQSILTGILDNHPEVLHNPSPFVFFKGLGESSLDFTVFAWIPNYNEGLRIKSELLFSIFEALKMNNIEIPFPQHDLHLKSIDKSITKENIPAIDNRK